MAGGRGGHAAGRGHLAALCRDERARYAEAWAFLCEGVNGEGLDAEGAFPPSAEKAAFLWEKGISRRKRTCRTEGQDSLCWRCILSSSLLCCHYLPVGRRRHYPPVCLARGLCYLFPFVLAWRICGAGILRDGWRSTLPLLALAPHCLRAIPQRRRSRTPSMPLLSLYL